ncbi:hypothetical protein TCAL_17334 [Tigriopus californicus]|uniref:Uncharacterized protein n=1 Tax=Tigriopus californicus TaxID=6832 RepID=A0A553NYF0_TIGCA|nr:uncharacterized protein LOC131886111 [Tigriopus californicus]TRY70459.1 hypothetical protein TCAL_17334 [Tigriopus californicus]
MSSASSGTDSKGQPRHGGARKGSRHSGNGLTSGASAPSGHRRSTTHKSPSRGRAQPDQPNMPQYEYKLRHSNRMSTTYQQPYPQASNMVPPGYSSNEPQTPQSCMPTGGTVAPTTGQLRSGHIEVDTLYGNGGAGSAQLTVNAMNAPNNSTMQCGCENIDCPFCNLMLSVQMKDSY